MIFLIYMSLAFFGLNVSAFETVDAVKKDFHELKTKTFPEKKAKLKKKISETANKVNSSIQKKTND